MIATWAWNCQYYSLIFSIFNVFLFDVSGDLNVCKDGCPEIDLLHVPILSWGDPRQVNRDYKVFIPGKATIISH